LQKKLMALLIGTSFVLAACGGAGEDQSTGETTSVDEASQLYKNSCSQCHGGKLEGGFGPALNASGENLSQEEIITIIEEGKGRMPANLLQSEEAALVAEWIVEQKQ
jgi:cytochrome c551